MGGGGVRRRRGGDRGGRGAAAVAPYIGAAAAVPHDGSNLPPWPTAGAALTAVAHSGRLPRAPLPAADRWRPPCRRGPWRFPCKPSWRTAVGCQICKNFKRSYNFAKWLKKYKKNLYTKGGEGKTLIRCYSAPPLQYPRATVAAVNSASGEQ
jgi:hypothetical protein